jgi:hypothetical protein
MSNSKLCASDPTHVGVDKLLSIVNSCEIKNKDLVIPHDELYLIEMLLNNIQSVIPERGRWSWDGTVLSKDCPF